MKTRSSLIIIGTMSAAITMSVSASALTADLIVSKLNGYVIDIYGGSQKPGTGLDAYPRNTPIGSPDQLWQEVYDNVTGYVYLQSVMDGDVVDISASSSWEELDAWPQKLWTNGNPSNQPYNQLWKIVADPAGSDYVFLQSYLNGNVIDINGGVSTAGQWLDAYPMKSSDYDNQLWQIVRIEIGDAATCTIQTGSFPNQECQDYLESATGFWLPSSGVTSLCPTGCQYGCSWGQDFHHQSCPFSSY